MKPEISLHADAMPQERSRVASTSQNEFSGPRRVSERLEGSSLVANAEGRVLRDREERDAVKYGAYREGGNSGGARSSKAQSENARPAPETPGNTAGRGGNQCGTHKASSGGATGQRQGGGGGQALRWEKGRGASI